MERKIESFWPKNLGQFFFQSLAQLFSLNDSFFSLSALIEKTESFLPKNLGQIFVLPVIEFFLGQILVPPVIKFFGSKWLIFSLGALSEKTESFF